MNITLPDGSIHQYQDGMTAFDIAADISPRLRKATLAAELDGQRIDAFAPIHGDHSLKLLTFADENGRWAFRHTASHMLAQAVKRLYPDVKFAIGPAIENGFYYDFDTPEGFSFSPEDLAAIEKEWPRSPRKTCPCAGLSYPGKRPSPIWNNATSPIK